MVDTPVVPCSICQQPLEITYVPLDIQIRNIIVPHQMVQVAQCWNCGIRHAVVGLMVEGNRLTIVLEEDNGKDDGSKKR
jgi:hypothetical protein